MITTWIAERSATIFGFKITPVTEAELIEATANALDEGVQLIIASMNLHGLYVACVDEPFRHLHELPQTLVHTDGSAPIYLGWMHMLDVGFEHRTGVHDWLPALVKEAGRREWSVYCLGSEAEVNATAVERLRADSHGARIEGRDGYAGVDNGDALEAIEAFDPDILVVGMGMGRQEAWILQNLDRIGPRVVITCGACLEYMAGAMWQPPKWFGPTGLFMLWRVLSRPRRYGFRYLVEPWLLLFELMRSGRLAGSVRQIAGRRHK